MHPERQYLDLLRDILETGDRRIDRTGVGTLAVFGRMMRFDLAQGFPVFTTKKVLWRHAFIEMLWFLRGETNIRSLLQQGVTIWSEWPHKAYVQATGDAIDVKTFERRVLEDEAFAARWGDLGPVYGRQWRAWPRYLPVSPGGLPLETDARYVRDPDGIDQVAEALRLIREQPASRRIIVEGWNVAELDAMALPPCHKTYQFGVSNGRLNLTLVQRSVDSGLGLPFNVCGGALFLAIMAHQAGLAPGELVWFGIDTHIYLNHVDALRTQIAREPRPFPTLRIARKAESFDRYRIEDFELVGYDPHPAIRMAVAV